MFSKYESAFKKKENQVFEFLIIKEYGLIVRTFWNEAFLTEYFSFVLIATNFGTKSVNY